MSALNGDPAGSAVDGGQAAGLGRERRGAHGRRRGFGEHAATAAVVDVTSESAMSRTGYAFADPLSETRARTRRRIRHSHALIYGCAALSLLLAVLADGGPFAQRLAAGVAALVTALMATLMLLWHRAPDRLLLAGFPLAALTVTAIALLDPPLALTPMYYVWPLMTAAYFLRRREVLLTYGLTCLSFAAVAPWAVDQGPPVIHAATVAIVGGVVISFVGVLRVRLEDLLLGLRTLARVDALTGALNRGAILDTIDAAIAAARRTGTSCALALVDIDHFKAINDQFGHAAGDAALRRLVSVIAGRLRGGDALGRLGGEEFAVLLTGTDADGAAVYAHELRAYVARDAAESGMAFTVSVGVAQLDGKCTSADALLAAADAALYRAKRAGRDTVRAAA